MLLNSLNQPPLIRLPALLPWNTDCLLSTTPLNLETPPWNLIQISPPQLGCTSPRGTGVRSRIYWCGHNCHPKTYLRVMSSLILMQSENYCFDENQCAHLGNKEMEVLEKITFELGVEKTCKILGRNFAKFWEDSGLMSRLSRRPGFPCRAPVYTCSPVELVTAPPVIDRQIICRPHIVCDLYKKLHSANALNQ